MIGERRPGVLAMILLILDGQRSALSRVTSLEVERGPGGGGCGPREFRDDFFITQPQHT